MTAATALFRGLAFAAIFPRVPTPHDASAYMVPTEVIDWLNNALRTLRGADMNACVYSKFEPPTTLHMSIPVPSIEAQFLVGNEACAGWTRALSGTTVDFALAFKAQVLRHRGRAVRRGVWYHTANTLTDMPAAERTFNEAISLASELHTLRVLGFHFTRRMLAAEARRQGVPSKVFTSVWGSQEALALGQRVSRFIGRRLGRGRSLAR